MGAALALSHTLSSLPQPGVFTNLAGVFTDKVRNTSKVSKAIHWIVCATLSHLVSPLQPGVQPYKSGLFAYFAGLFADKVRTNG